MRCPPLPRCLTLPRHDSRYWIFPTPAAALLLAFSTSLRAACWESPIIQSASFTVEAGFSTDEGTTLTATAAPGTAAAVFAHFTPRPEHVGREALLRVYMESGLGPDATHASMVRTQQTRYLGVDGQWRLPQVALGQPFQPPVLPLTSQASQQAALFRGTLGGEDVLRLTADYCIDGQTFRAAASPMLTIAYPGPTELVLDFPPITAFTYTGNDLVLRGRVAGPRDLGTPLRVALYAGATLLDSVAVSSTGEWRFARQAVSAALSLRLISGDKILDGQDLQIQRTHHWLDFEGISLDSTTGTAYAVDSLMQRLYVFDPLSGQRKAIPLRGVPILPGGSATRRWLFEPGSRALLSVSSDAIPQILQLDVESGSVAVMGSLTAFTPAAAAPGVVWPPRINNLALDARRHELLLGDYTSGRVYAFDLQSGSSRLVAQVPARPLAQVDAARAPQPLGLQGLVVDAEHDRALMIQEGVGKIWAIALQSGAISEVFDETRATLVGTTPAELSNGLLRSRGDGGYRTLGYDAERRLVLVAVGRALTTVDLARNTLRLLDNGFTGQAGYLTAINVIEHDRAQDRYVFLDDQLDVVVSHSPQSGQTVRMPGSSARLAGWLDTSLAPAQTATQLLLAADQGTFRFFDLRQQSHWRVRPAVYGGVTGISFTPSILSRYMTNTLYPAAYDDTRDRYLMLRPAFPYLASDVVLPFFTERPPINEPTLGIRGIPAGVGTTGSSIVPLPATPTLALLPVAGSVLVPQPITPVYDGNLADLSFLSLAAIDATGEHYVVGDVLGRVFSLDPTTGRLEKLVDIDTNPAGLVALRFAGKVLVLLDARGDLYTLSLDPTAADFGERRLFTGSGAGVAQRVLNPGGLAFTANAGTALMTAPFTRELWRRDLTFGAVELVSGARRGQGEPFAFPQELLLLEDQATAYVRDLGSIVIVDLQSGDRLLWPAL